MFWTLPQKSDRATLLALSEGVVFCWVGSALVEELNYLGCVTYSRLEVLTSMSAKMKVASAPPEVKVQNLFSLLGDAGKKRSSKKAR